MLKSIDIHNFILINHQTVNFEKNINVITGDTGSGKSVLISAIRFALGSRGSNELFFEQDKDIKVTAKFVLTPQLIKRLEELQISYEDEIEVFRTYSQTGNNKIRINGELVSLKDLNTLFADVFTIYSQYSVAKFKNESNYLEIIDNLIVDKQVIANYNEQYKIYNQLYLDLEQLKTEQILKDERLSLLQMRSEDFKDINAEVNIDDLVLEKKHLTECLETANINKESTDIFDTVISGINNLQQIISNENLLNLLNDALINIEEVSYELAKDNRDIDEPRLGLITDYISNCKRLSRKYNLELTELGQYKLDLELEIVNLDGIESDIANLTNKLAKQYTVTFEMATALSTARKQIISGFTDNVNENMKKLSLDESDFKVEINEISLGKNGIDNISFLVRMNEGGEYSLIHKTASGGEIARFLLAMEATIIAEDGLIVFDEIDTGVSGAVASQMASMMRDISRNNKLIIVTHLAQVAAISQHHYLVSKQQLAGKTTSNVKLLETGEKPIALATMISGAEINEDAIAHAKQLLENGGK